MNDNEDSYLNEINPETYKNICKKYINSIQYALFLNNHK